MEKRFIEEEVEIRSSEGGKEFIEGYGVVFNKQSRKMITKSGMEFREVISPEAFSKTDFSRTIARANHNNAQLLGTSKAGTLKLRMDDKGIFYSVELPNTTVGRDIKEHMRRGDITGSSFAFPINSRATISRDSDGMILRTIKDISYLGDIGPVVSPAYEDSSSNHTYRDIEKFIEEERKSESENSIEISEDENGWPQAKLKETKEKPDDKATAKPSGLSLTERLRLERLRG